MRNGTTAKTEITLGLSTNTTVTSDRDGESLTDAGVFRPFIRKFNLKSGMEKTVILRGPDTDIPVSGKWS